MKNREPTLRYLTPERSKLLNVASNIDYYTLKIVVWEFITNNMKNYLDIGFTGCSKWPDLVLNESIYDHAKLLYKWIWDSEVDNFVEFLEESLSNKKLLNSKIVLLRLSK